MTATAQPSARATAAATAAAPVRHPAHAPAPAPKRPPLRVVQPGERPRRVPSAKRNSRLLVASAVMLGGCLFFGLVAAHVVLTQNQFQLQRAQRQAAQEQARYERLRAQVAELESPARVVAAAQERLGMVSPASVKYLTPALPPPAKPAPKTGATAQPDTRTTGQRAQGNAQAQGDDGQAMTDWSVVKRHLSSRP